jgi:3-hydroxybutyrate dehydrogenase
VNVSVLKNARLLPFASGMLRGRSAVVTGSTSGIGLGIAEVLAMHGADLLLNGLGDCAEIEQVRQSLAESYGVLVSYSAADMLKPAEIDGMIEQATRDLGGVDILVNNAGIQHMAPVRGFPVERWGAIIAINLSAAFYATRAVLPHMESRGWGRIINIASTHGLVASVHESAYVAAKHGLIGLTKVVALETATTGVTCNAICPGCVLTPLVQKQIDDIAIHEAISVEAAAEQLLGGKQPSLAFVTPGQIGALAVFLCSDAAAQIRGAALPVDGGWTSQ